MKVMIHLNSTTVELIEAKLDHKHPSYCIAGPMTMEYLHGKCVYIYKLDELQNAVYKHCK